MPLFYIMFQQQTVIALTLFLFSIQNCTHQPTQYDPSTTQKISFKSPKELLADTVILHISNGSLTPEYQFSKEWVLTEKEAVYRETVGEEPEVVIRKKMDLQFWESVRRFDKNMTYDPPEILEGADEADLIFYVSGKAYRFPFLAMEGRVASIQDFFEPN